MRVHVLSLSTFIKGGGSRLTPPSTKTEALSFFLDPKSSGAKRPCWRSYPLRYERRTRNPAACQATVLGGRLSGDVPRERLDPEATHSFLGVSKELVHLLWGGDGVAHLLARVHLLYVFLVGPEVGPTLAA